MSEEIAKPQVYIGFSWRRVFTAVVLIVGLLALLSLIFLYILDRESRNPYSTTYNVASKSASKSSSPIVNPLIFQDATIITSLPFVNSAGEKRKFLILSENGKTDQAYITDENKTKSTAVKLTGYSAEAFTGCGGGDIEALKGCVENNRLISASPGTGKKYIIVYSQGGDGSSIWLYDESGKLISNKVGDDAYAPVKNLVENCPCTSIFDKWKDADEFYVKVENYQILVDAKTGLVVGSPKKVS